MRTKDGFVGALVGDGTPLLLACAGALAFSGGFAIFLAATGEFLPQDVHYLGMTAGDLCRLAGCRIVDFMIHDRAAWGGSLFGIGVIYAWVILFPLRRGDAWAWWLLALSGSIGFLTFLAYLGYGYLDTWHGLGTLLLVPVFVAGLWKTRHRRVGVSVRELLRPAAPLFDRSRRGLGRLVLIAGAAGSAGGGLLILGIGVTDIFVPEDLEFMGRSAGELRSIDDRLVPLMAHDRAGFGGAVLTLSLTTLGCLWKNRLTRDLWQAVAIAGGASLSAAIGVHFIVGYTDIWHLLPALSAAAALVIGLTIALDERRPSERAVQQEARGRA